jgi:nicotinate-nucleotide adenylyltransferase
MSDKTFPAIGIIGGSFDPVHNGHCLIAQAALDHFGLEKVLFVPAGILPHKSKNATADGAHRLAMLRLAIADNKSFSALDMEIRRPGRSYTVDTLSILARMYPERALYFIIGSDNLAEIPTWHKYKTLLSMITLCVAGRRGHPVRLPESIKNVKIRAFNSPRWEISSSLIRDYLKTGRSCRYLLAPQVSAYIKKHNLYVTGVKKITGKAIRLCAQ